MLWSVLPGKPVLRDVIPTEGFAQWTTRWLLVLLPKTESPERWGLYSTIGDLRWETHYVYSWKKNHRLDPCIQHIQYMQSICIHYAVFKHSWYDSVVVNVLWFIYICLLSYIYTLIPTFFY
jgi:hypothetical protein